MVRVVWAAARGRVVLVTDATAAAGRADGRFALGDVALDVTDGAVRNSDGALAGSALTLSAAIVNAVALGIDPVEALRAVTSAPAALIGRDDIGRAAPGARADVSVLDDGLRVRETYLAAYPSHEPAHLRDRRAARGAGPAAGPAASPARRLGAVLHRARDRRGPAGRARHLRQRGEVRAVPLAAPDRPARRPGDPEPPHRVRRPDDVRGKAVVALSQSGASPDVVAVVQAARATGRSRSRSPTTRTHRWHLAAAQVLPLHAGPERSVAATKTYTASLLAVAVLGLALERPGRRRRRELAGCRTPSARRSAALTGIDAAAALLARSIAASGRPRPHLGTAYEAALKLTELTGALSRRTPRRT